ncbi:MAG: aldose 1-epimerase [Pseudorhodobacter sp.]|jgi:aldose 1-epimerase
MIEHFGTTAEGQQVQAVTLRAGIASVRLLSFGAILQDFRLAGLPYSLTLGSQVLADYEGAMCYHGALIGPVANRISGASAVIDGQLHRFDDTQPGGITLHSGAAGTHRKHWTILEAGAADVTFSVTLHDGEGGFPGTRHITARFALSPPATLRLTVEVATNAPTPLNFAQHSYWNLDGSATWAGHSLRIPADDFTPVDAAYVPTGEVKPVAGTDLDFRTLRQIAPGHPEMDTNFCLSNDRTSLREILTLRGASGVELTLASTEPGVQIYDGRPAYRGLAIEPQFWPDALAQPSFPQIVTASGPVWRQVSEWRFCLP